MLVGGLVGVVPIGTNLGPLDLCWMPRCGKRLLTRGAICPGLSGLGRSEGAVRRAWSGLGQGRWTSQRRVQQWARVVAAEGWWQPRRQGGYHPVAADSTGASRPRWQGCRARPSRATAGQALPAIPLGIIARVGRVAQQRVGRPLKLARADPNDPRPSAHRRVLLTRAVEGPAPTDGLVMDREFTVGQAQAAGATVGVTRRRQNLTARRAAPPP